METIFIWSNMLLWVGCPASVCATPLRFVFGEDHTMIWAQSCDIQKFMWLLWLLWLLWRYVKFLHKHSQWRAQRCTEHLKSLPSAVLAQAWEDKVASRVFCCDSLCHKDGRQTSSLSMHLRRFGHDGLGYDLAWKQFAWRGRLCRPGADATAATAATAANSNSDEWPKVHCSWSWHSWVWGMEEAKGCREEGCLGNDDHGKWIPGCRCWDSGVCACTCSCSCAITCGPGWWWRWQPISVHHWSLQSNNDHNYNDSASQPHWGFL